MKTNLLAMGALAAALALPIGASAQQSQPPAAQSYGHRNPSPAKLHHRWMKRLSRLNLSGDQQQRVQSILDQYSQAHPEGSPADRNASRELRRQLMSVLSPDQLNQYHQAMRARHEQMQQRRAQMQQGTNGQQYQQQYQQGQRDQQGPPAQQGPPEQQGPPYQQGQPDQQGPPEQQGPPYQQGPPDQQGPPEQQGPPDQPSGPPPPR